MDQYMIPDVKKIIDDYCKKIICKQCRTEYDFELNTWCSNICSVGCLPVLERKISSNACNILGERHVKYIIDLKRQTIDKDFSMHMYWSIAAAIIYFYVKKNNINIKLQTISDNCVVSKLTIKKIYLKINKKYLEIY